MKIASKRTLNDMVIAAGLLAQHTVNEFWEANVNEIGTMGTLRQAKSGEGGSMHDV